MSGGAELAEDSGAFFGRTGSGGPAGRGAAADASVRDASATLLGMPCEPSTRRGSACGETGATVFPDVALAGGGTWVTADDAGRDLFVTASESGRDGARDWLDRDLVRRDFLGIGPDGVGFIIQPATS